MAFLNSEYIHSAPGLLKIFHIVLGIISGILVSIIFLEGVAGVSLLLFTVSACFVISSIYFLALLRFPALNNLRKNQQVEFLYHAVAAFLLIISGIDSAAWGNYSEICQDYCPSPYLIVTAKIITFMNGTLYGIVAFLSTRTWKSISPEENIELLKSNEHTDVHLDLS